MKTVSTTPPAAMLSKKFWREGEIPEPVASATSGITIETLRAAAAKPLTALSIFRFDAFTWNLSERMAAEEDDALDGFKGDDLSKAMVFADDDNRLWVSGMNNDTAEVEAISFSLFFYLFEFVWQYEFGLWEETQDMRSGRYESYVAVSELRSMIL